MMITTKHNHHNLNTILFVHVAVTTQL